MSNLQVGDQAPFFSEKNQNGKIVSLSDYKQQKIILYFYPKDNTPGCTNQACDLRNHYSKFIQDGFNIIGVSPDDVDTHCKFIDKFQLPFNLIADVDKKICTAYGVFGKKRFMGKEYYGVHRTTFIINRDSIIEKIFTKVKTKEHSLQILESYINN